MSNTIVGDWPTPPSNVVFAEQPSDSLNGHVHPRKFEDKSWRLEDAAERLVLNPQTRQQHMSTRITGGGIAPRYIILRSTPGDSAL